MKQTTHRRGDGLLQIVSILSASVTLTALSATAQPPPSGIDVRPRGVEESHEEADNSPQPLSSPSTAPSGVPPTSPINTVAATPSPTPTETPPAGNQPGAPLPQSNHQHTPLPFLSRQPQQPAPPVIQQEATEGYRIFPLEQTEAPPHVCAPHPGYGPGERILFPPTLGFQDVWALFYLDKYGECYFALPMSEGNWGTGDWWELRHPLVDHGINIIGSYGSDIQGNVAGGLSPGFGYADCIDLRLDLDLQKLVGWNGAHFVISGIDRNGNNLTKQHVGNVFNVAQIWGDQTINYYALWLTQDLFDGWWNIKLGRIAATDDFTSNPLIYGLYLSNAIDGQPFAVAASGFVSAYPAAVWGGRLRFNDKEHNLYAMFGIYQTSDRLYKPKYHGVDFSMRRNDGMNLLWEVGWLPEFQPHTPPASFTAQASAPTPSSVTPETWHGMPGHYKFGIFYTPWQNIPQFLPGNTFYSYGFYWLFDQMVYQAAPGSTRGLTLWSAFIYAPAQNTSLIPFQASGGAIYTGLIPRRSNDQLVFGCFYGTFSSNYATTQRIAGNGNPTYELVLEAGYRINLSTFFYIEPDVQYVIHPGGTGRIPNAWVIGAQIGFSF